jgi:predicted dehydrogenase
MRDTVNLAFVGTGAWAQRYHFPTLAHLREEGMPLRLCGVTSLELEEAERLAACYNFERVYPDLDALMGDDTLNAVAVAISPEALHDVLNRLVSMDVPIFSEKPPGVTLQQAQSLSKKVTVPNVVAFNRRYAPINTLFKTTVDAMTDVYFVEGHFMRHRRLDETFMIGTGIHWINFMTYCFGDIHHVSTTRLRNPLNETWIRFADLSFAGGLRGRLKVLPCSGSQYERLDVHSNAQSVYLHGPLWDQPGRIIIERGGERKVLTPEDDAVSYAVDRPEFVRLGIAGEYREFINAVLRGKPTRSNFQNAVNSVRVAEAMEYGFDF